jgi:pyridoxal phosphate-dependent aminotransferase EpsN
MCGRELDFVHEAFRTNWIAPAGPDLEAFEQEICRYTGAPHAVALASGTAAIHLALLVLGVGRGDEVICSTFTFAGSTFPIAYQGATPVFVDSEPTSWNMNPALLEHALESIPDLAVLSTDERVRRNGLRLGFEVLPTGDGA